MACRANDCHFNIFQIRKTKSSTKDLWVMTSVETLGYFRDVPPGQNDALQVVEG